MDECDDHQMMRTTIAIDDEVADALQRYRSHRDVEVSVNAVVQAALKDFLAARGYLPGKKRLRITPAEKGSGYTDRLGARDEAWGPG